MPRNALLYLVLAAAALSTPARGEDISGYGGAELFRRYCASCHGMAADGKGPVAPFFHLLPPDLTQITKRHGGEFPAAKITRVIDGQEDVKPHGSREMPVWGMELAAAGGTDAAGRQRATAAITRLVEYLRSLQR